ncbi:oligosaccharide flippase family protein [Limosilactobacillus reuteri]|uniref:oligosaccharide flippase family protein n=1 Tax=Limosilactobacillus reuteri TaxID=1598 RepID=UPI002D1FA0D2|nr:oligosaccharide flippase family protein [Limosilactobacillus reuteri]
MMLYGLNFAQLILPLLTMPYLTRVLSVDGYGVVSYVKAVMVYIMLIIEFGFILSGTREVVEARNNSKLIGEIIGKITQAKLILAFLSFILLLFMIKFIPILGRYPLFTLLSFIPPFLSIFLFDYLFRGLEKMQILTIRYLITKGISTILTFLVIRNDSEIVLIPLLDIIGSIVAIIWIVDELNKNHIKIMFAPFTEVLANLKLSFTYFLSNIAETAFTTLNTICIGIFFSSADVAYWGVVMTVINAIQSMYTPISDGIYPNMIKSRSLNLFLKIVFFFIPFLILGSICLYFGSSLIVLLIGGDKYLIAAKYLREFIPLIIISFFSILFGWPLLGAIGKVRETTFTTVIASIFQILGIVILIISHSFTINSLIILRTITELLIAILRLKFAWKFKGEFKKY